MTNTAQEENLKFVGELWKLGEECVKQYLKWSQQTNLVFAVFTVEIPKSLRDEYDLHDEALELTIQIDTEGADPVFLYDKELLSPQPLGDAFLWEVVQQAVKQKTHMPIMTNQTKH